MQVPLLGQTNFQEPVSVADTTDVGFASELLGLSEFVIGYDCSIDTMSLDSGLNRSFHATWMDGWKSAEGLDAFRIRFRLFDGEMHSMAVGKKEPRLTITTSFPVLKFFDFCRRIPTTSSCFQTSRMHRRCQSRRFQSRRRVCSMERQRPVRWNVDIGAGRWTSPPCRCLSCRSKP
jgi:hypothetical protein